MMKLDDFTKWIILALAVFFMFVKPMFIDKDLLATDYSWTRCKIIDREAAAEGAPSYIYEYYIGKKRYTSEFVETPQFDAKIGECYLLKYYPPDPSICDIKLDSRLSCNSTDEVPFQFQHYYFSKEK